MVRDESQRVLLVRTTFKMYRRNMGLLSLSAPLGVAQIAGVARSVSGTHVGVLDCLVEGMDDWQALGNGFVRIGLADEVIADRIRAFKPDIVGLSNLFTPQVGELHRIARLIKEVDSQIIVVAGGVHPTLFPEETLNNSSIDHVVIGEGELPFKRLLEARGLSNGHIKGVYNRIHRIREFDPPADLDSLPIPAYDLLPMELYGEAARKYDVTTRGGSRRLTASMVTSRGCPYKCNFCSIPGVEGHKWRARSSGRVVDEMEHLASHYGITRFSIEDSNFTLLEQRAIDICEEIRRRRLDVRFNLPNGLRADRMSPRLARAMQRAGCEELTIAVEHGNQDFLNTFIKKMLKLERVPATVDGIVGQSIASTAFFIIGFPNETRALLGDTRDLAWKLARRGCMPQINFAMPYPKTPLEEYAIDNGYLQGRLSDEALLRGSAEGFGWSNTEVEFAELVRWRRAIYVGAAWRMLVNRPLAFFRLPFVRATLSDLLTPGRAALRVRKLVALLNRGM